MNALAELIAVAVLGVASAGSGTDVAGLQEALVPSPKPEMDWGAWVSDVPMRDLSGEWIFDATASDPMLEIWADREIVYRIVQFNDRIRFEFRPTDAQPTIQTYLWTGAVTESRVASVEVRERGRWTDAGRTFEVEGRRWYLDEVDAVTRFTFRYVVETADILAFHQNDEYGSTVWRFRRR